MPSVVQRFKTGPRTRPVAEAVTGGQLVEARTGSAVGVAAAGSVKCVGVALDDADPTGTPSTPTMVGGRPVLSAVVVPKAVAVAGGGETVSGVTYAANAAYGQRLKCAANGQVTPYVPGTDDAGLIIGYCDEIAGVASGATGDTYIF